MTIDDMVKDLYEYSGLTLETVAAIVASLKAGQAMRDAFEVDYYAGSTAFIDTMDKEKLLEAGQAWDAALKGDKG